MSQTDMQAKSAGVSQRSPTPEIGNRLRLRRKVKRLTLAELSAMAGVSTAQLSQIERGNAMPSVDRLVMLCQALDMPLTWLFDDGGNVEPQTSPYILRSNMHRHIKFRESGMAKDMLTPDAIPQVQMMRIVLQPHASSGDQPYNEPEGAKCGVVLRGVLGLEIDGERHLLNAGDSCAFPATAMIRLWAEDVETEVIWATTPAFY